MSSHPELVASPLILTSALLSNLAFIAHQTIYVILGQITFDLYMAFQYSLSILASGGAGNWTRDLSTELATLHHSGMDTLNSDSWFINYYVLLSYEDG